MGVEVGVLVDALFQMSKLRREKPRVQLTQRTAWAIQNSDGRLIKRGARIAARQVVMCATVPAGNSGSFRALDTYSR